MCVFTMGVGDKVVVQGSVGPVGEMQGFCGKEVKFPTYYLI